MPDRPRPPAVRSSRPRRGLLGVACLGLAFALGSSLAGRFAGADARDDARAAIRRVLDDQVAAWNRGDLDAFLAGYWRSPRVVFLSGGTRHDGFDAMRDRYRRRYQGEGRAMGRLAFSELEVEPLGGGADPADAFARGRYTLAMPDGTHPTGLFTLILRRFDDGWRIVHDHTSAAEAAPAPPPTPPAPR